MKALSCKMINAALPIRNRRRCLFQSFGYTNHVLSDKLYYISQALQSQILQGNYLPCRMIGLLRFYFLLFMPQSFRTAKIASAMENNIPTIAKSGTPPATSGFISVVQRIQEPMKSTQAITIRMV